MRAAAGADPSLRGLELKGPHPLADFGQTSGFGGRVPPLCCAAQVGWELWLGWSLVARAAMRWDLEGSAYGMCRRNLIEFGIELVVFLPGFRLFFLCLIFYFLRVVLQLPIASFSFLLSWLQGELLPVLQHLLLHGYC